MNSNKIISKKAAFFMAAAALVCGFAGARPSGLVINPGHDDDGIARTRLNVTNGPTGCVRVFVNGQRNLPAGASANLGTVEAGKPYMASIFGKTCGGAAVKNVWFTPTVANSVQTWTVK